MKAVRGPWLGRAYIKGFGMVSVFADDAHKDMFFVENIGRGRYRGQTRYVARYMLAWRK